MTWLDVTTYLLKGSVSFFAITGVGFLISLIASGTVCDEIVFDNKNSRKICALIFIPVILIAFIVSFTPTHKRLLWVKIEKIKNEAVNEQNLRDGVKVIERIGKKLECKYLGGEGCLDQVKRKASE